MDHLAESILNAMFEDCDQKGDSSHRAYCNCGPDELVPTEQGRKLLRQIAHYVKEELTPSSRGGWRD